MEGKIFSKWTVIKLIKAEKPGKYYECICECGNIRIKAGTELRAGRGKQCTECMYAELYNPMREIGKKYGKWTIVEYVGMHRKLQQFKIKCDCGFESINVAADLRAGKTKQCSICHNRENVKNNTLHGRHKDPIYKTWTSMVQRCTNPNVKFYYRYGGRGIKICDRWLDFKSFIEDMGERPDGMTIDRINNDGNYEPTNCHWVTHKDNCNNRSNKKIKKS